MINLNEEKYGQEEIAVFNAGETGPVDNVTIRIEKKSPDAADNKPDYKLIGSDGIGEVNEGFYYQENENDPGWKNFQADKLKLLVRGIMGEDFQIPPFNTPREGLDIAMNIAQKGAQNKLFRVFVTYGTTQRTSKYLRLKSFGSFIEQMSVPESKLQQGRADLMIRPEVKASSDEEIDILTSDSGESDVPWEA